jgi:Tol biopolymer transport system component
VQSMMRGYAWYPDNRSMLVSSDHEGEQALYRVDVASGAMTALGVSDTKFPDVARNAPVAVFQKESQLTQLSEVALVGSEKGKARMLAPSTRSDMYPSYSPDARRLAFVSSRSGSSQVWLYEFATDNASPLTRYDGQQVATPRWSPDGTRVLHIVRGGGRSTLHVAEVESGRSQALTGAQENVRFGSYSHDGRSIYFSSDRGGQWRAWRMPAAGGKAELIVPQGAIDPQDPLGDGKIYYTRETYRGLLQLDLATGREAVVSPFVGYWNLNAWALTSKGLFLLDSGEETVEGGLFRMDAVARDPASREPVPRKLVLPIEQTLSTMDMTITPTADRMVVVATTRDETDLMSLTLEP